MNFFRLIRKTLGKKEPAVYNLASVIQAGDVSSARFILGVKPALLSAIKPNPFAYFPSAEMVELFLTRGLSVNATYEDGDTALFLVNTPEVVRTLLNHGADVNARNGKGLSALHVAVKMGWDAKAEVLIDGGADVDGVDAHGRTPLHYAALQNRAGAARLLLNHGASANPQDASGRSPLWLTIEKESSTSVVAAFFNFVDLLLSYGADPNLPDNLDKSPFDLVVERGYKQHIVDALTCAGADVNRSAVTGRSRLHVALEAGNTFGVKLLLNCGAFPNAQDAGGITPLHLLCSTKDPRYEIGKLLLQHGADANVPDAKGWTPFHTLVARADCYLLEYLVRDLLDSGASVDLKTPMHGNALHLSLPNGERIPAILLDNHCDVNARDLSLQTPLHLAAKHKTAQIVLRLIEKGADINARDKLGQTPLHVAARTMEASRNQWRPANWRYQSESRAAMKALLEHGADVDAKDAKGQTALHIACESRGRWTAELLVRFGANLLLQAYDGVSPWDLLRRNGFKTLTDFVRFLDNDDGTVFDTQTFLLWQKADDGQNRSWVQAQEYCSSLSLGGRSDWRVPSEEELYSRLRAVPIYPVSRHYFIDSDGQFRYYVIDSDYFADRKSGFYWSSTIYPNGTGRISGPSHYMWSEFYATIHGDPELFSNPSNAFTVVVAGPFPDWFPAYLAKWLDLDSGHQD